MVLLFDYENYLIDFMTIKSKYSIICSINENYWELMPFYPKPEKIVYMGCEIIK